MNETREEKGVLFSSIYIYSFLSFHAECSFIFILPGIYIRIEDIWIYIFYIKKLLFTHYLFKFSR